MSATDDILAMLDRVEERMLRCPVCNRSNELFFVYVEGYSVPALPSVTGDLYTQGDSECVDIPPTVAPARWINCGNVALHPDKLWHWFPCPEGVTTRSDTHLDWDGFMAARADAP